MTNQRGYSRQDILELFRLIDWMMTLPKGIESRFKQEFRRFEEDLQMPCITSFERLGREEGILLKGREASIPASLTAWIKYSFSDYS